MFSVSILGNVVGQLVRRNLYSINANSLNTVNVTSALSFALRQCSSINSSSTNGSLRHSEFRNITKDRSTPVPVEASIRYIKSDAYKQTYGEEPVWTQYRRNHKGALPPRKTRRTCIRQNVISTGNPCPVCRDEYLVLNENNTDLLHQFISPYTGAILSYQVTGLCQKRHQELMIAVQRARDRGLLTFDVPFRKYNYNDYYKPEQQQKQ